MKEKINLISHLVSIVEVGHGDPFKPPLVALVPVDLKDPEGGAKPGDEDSESAHTGPKHVVVELHTHVTLGVEHGTHKPGRNRESNPFKTLSKPNASTRSCTFTFFYYESTVKVLHLN